MTNYELYSLRLKREAGEIFPDTYVYDRIPDELKVQIWKIIQKAIGNLYSNGKGQYFDTIHAHLCEEYGVFGLNNGEVYPAPNDYFSRFNIYQIQKFFFEPTYVSEDLDVIELLFRLIDIIIRNKPQLIINIIAFFPFDDAEITPDEAIDKLNTRFKQHGMGYQFDINTNHQN